MKVKAPAAYSWMERLESTREVCLQWRRTVTLFIPRLHRRTAGRMERQSWRQSSRDKGSPKGSRPSSWATHVQFFLLNWWFSKIWFQVPQGQDYLCTVRHYLHFHSLSFKSVRWSFPRLHTCYCQWLVRENSFLPFLSHTLKRFAKSVKQWHLHSHYNFVWQIYSFIKCYLW